MNDLPIVFALLLFIPGGAAHPDDGRRNPFAHTPKPVTDSGLDAAATNRPATRMQVRAILLAGEQSLVSIDGTLLGIGESYRGFLLQSVQENAAVFVRDGDTLTVPLFEPRESDEES